MRSYILDSEDWPVLINDNQQWAKWHMAHQDRCQMALTQDPGFLVVTRFLGLDHNFTGRGEPLLYRVSLWGAGKYRQWLYETRSQALKGHYLAVREARRMPGRDRSAGITIRMLTLAGRRVTVSVFRQIEEEPIIDSRTLTLRGVPWGHVNYHWGGYEP